MLLMWFAARKRHHLLHTHVQTARDGRARRWTVTPKRLSARAVVVLLLLPTDPARVMDTARAEAHVDEAVEKFGVSGKGVLVAVMDRGIDWRNDDFRNDDG